MKIKTQGNGISFCLSRAGRPEGAQQALRFKIIRFLQLQEREFEQ